MNITLGMRRKSSKGCRWAGQLKRHRFPIDRLQKLYKSLVVGKGYDQVSTKHKLQVE